MKLSSKTLVVTLVSSPAIVSAHDFGLHSLRGATVEGKQTQESRGLQSINPRIINGQIVEAPYPSFVQWEVGCGATLIHDDIAVSAAHCYIEPLARRVWIGGDELNQGAGQRHIVEYFVNPTYQDATYEGDIVLLKLNETALGVEGVSLSSFNRNPSIPADDAKLLVMGYGHVDGYGKKQQKNLREVELLAVNGEECLVNYNSTDTFNDTYFSFNETSPVAISRQDQGDTGGYDDDISFWSLWGQGILPEFMICAANGDNPEGGNADSCQGKT